MRERADERSRHGIRVLRLPRAATALIAIPALLALGAASGVAFLVGVSALVLAPRLRALGGRRGVRGGRTITLDPTSYRRMDEPPSGDGHSLLRR